MKTFQVHQSLQEFSEVVFVDITSHVDRLNTAVTVLLCASSFGAFTLDNYSLSLLKMRKATLKVFIYSTISFFLFYPHSDLAMDIIYINL